MRSVALVAVLVLAGCASVNRFDNLEDRVDRLRKELNHTQNNLSVDRVVEKENGRFERVLDYLHQLALESKGHLKLIGQLQDENVMRFAEMAQVRKDLADVCALLRKYYKIHEDHICSAKMTKKLQSNSATENEIILEEFNKKVKRIERRPKKK